MHLHYLIKSKCRTESVSRFLFLFITQLNYVTSSSACKYTPAKKEKERTLRLLYVVYCQLVILERQ